MQNSHNLVENTTDSQKEYQVEGGGEGGGGWVTVECFWSSQNLLLPGSIEFFYCLYFIFGSGADPEISQKGVHSFLPQGEPSRGMRGYASLGDFEI